ncbi:MAG TPA: hydantoinase B/oxoprolinase family protein, partial [Planctomycetaceae bacterium]|nr:hydantoinase B/oxoprolinase family protein [Planctomycetaceae bacterium]
IVLPECLLNPPEHDDPAECAAIVGGNVETSQRVVDVLLGALGAAAASQGTMNNLTFGDDTFGYYETICGGSGATRESDGADAVHTHMTNTRLTDPEVIERRYPVRVVEFSIRRSSGGRTARASSQTRAVGKDLVIKGFEHAILSAARQHFGEGTSLALHIDRDSGKPILLNAGEPVDEVLLDEILGRMSTQAAKQIMIQELLETEAKAAAGAEQRGLHRGGDGVIRRLEFLRPLRVSILSERRGSYAPFGLNGGAAGALGRNSLQRAGSEFAEDLGGKAQVSVAAGDILTIETPGGGAFGGGPAQP